MLRAVVWLLLLLNLTYWAWRHRWLEAWGVWAAPQIQTEPVRLAQQVQPERIRLLAPDAPEISAPVSVGQTAVVVSNADETPTNPASPTSPTDGPQSPALAGPEANANPLPTPSPATSTPEPLAQAAPCRQAAYFNEKELPRAEAAFKAALPDGTWTLAPVPQPARWIVYTGKLSGPEALAEKKAELRQLKINFREVGVPALQPGLALGTFNNEEAALHGVRDVARNGYKGAKAVVERPEYTLYTLQLPQATDVLKTQAMGALTRLGEVKAAKQWQSCGD
jgi:hypothetical protein